MIEDREIAVRSGGAWHRCPWKRIENVSHISLTGAPVRPLVTGRRGRGQNHVRHASFDR